MTWRVLTGDCRDVLRSLDAGSVHTCVTSPPYFGLRDYGHDGQIGLEPTPDEFVAALVETFREVRRVLRHDGTLWLNLGDSWGDSKQLQGIPWRVAFALQADGWTLRSDIIWAKPNPMPESVTDRPTKAHEYLFLLSKSPRYYYDADAIAEAALQPIGEARMTGQHKALDPRGNGASSRSRLGTNQGGGDAEQAIRLDGRHAALRGRALRHISASPGGAVHPRRVPGRRHGARPLQRRRDHGDGRAASQPLLRRDRTQPRVRRPCARPHPRRRAPLEHLRGGSMTTHAHSYIHPVSRHDDVPRLACGCGASIEDDRDELVKAFEMLGDLAAMPSGLEPAHCDGCGKDRKPHQRYPDGTVLCFPCVKEGERWEAREAQTDRSRAVAFIRRENEV